MFSCGNSNQSKQMKVYIPISYYSYCLRLCGEPIEQVKHLPEEYSTEKLTTCQQTDPNWYLFRQPKLKSVGHKTQDIDLTVRKICREAGEAVQGIR